jgi:hypothetical protein
MKTFRNEVVRMWLWALRRRSQRTRWTRDKFLEKLGNLYRKSKFCIRTRCALCVLESPLRDESETTRIFDGLHPR